MGLQKESWHTLTVLVATLLVLQQAHAANVTARADVEALLGLRTAFREGTEDISHSILKGWDTDSDPCSDWEGVICGCRALPWQIMDSCKESNNTSGARIRALDLSLGTRQGMKKISGTIHARIGDLTELVYLDLSDNSISGALPATMANLKKLQWLTVENNQITGTLPDFTAQLPNLTVLNLQNNQFTKNIPSDWCSGSAVFYLAGNNGLCGNVPKCFANTNRVGSIERTYLSTTAFSADGGQLGGACDETAPDCDADIGCMIWVPNFWTSLSIVHFNFTGYFDYESSIVGYEWFIGTQPFQSDVVKPINVTGTKLLKEIKLGGGKVKKMFVTPVYYNLTAVSLLEGQAYYVTVTAFNGAGPPLSTDSTSSPVYVDTSGPLPASVYNTYDFQQASITRLANTLQASWDNFTDPQSGVIDYTVQFFQQSRNSTDGTVQVLQITEPLSLGLANRVQLRASPLKDGIMYYAEVTATNAANLTTIVQSLPILVQRDVLNTVPAGTVALIVVLCSLGCGTIGFIVSMLFSNYRYELQEEQRKTKLTEQKQIKQLMQAMVNYDTGESISPGSIGVSMTGQCAKVDKEEEHAFVCTDIESSTELSSKDPDAFKALQEYHDSIMREAISRYHGYEIITEGDSFQVRFGTVHEAVAFCTDVQYKLMEVPWTKNIMKLDACQAKFDDLGNPTFSGPRIRMGVHWAKKGTVAVKVHNITRHKVYAGSAMVITQEVSDAACGGQILLTEDAVEQLADHMPKANFPILRLIGQFQLQAQKDSVYLYSITEVVGKPMRRHNLLGAPRKIKQLWPDNSMAGPIPMALLYNISSMPAAAGEQAPLAFVALRLTTYPKDARHRTMPNSLREQMEEVIATQAQQFKGYIFQGYANAFDEGVWNVVFKDSIDALRFTHAAQLMLNYTQWPTQHVDGWYGETLNGPDGRAFFNGPRVCMSIHESADYAMTEELLDSCPKTLQTFGGKGVLLSLILTYAGRGGQVLLSEQAWLSVKPMIMRHTGAHSVISLGTHILNDGFSAMLLMEVMPNMLSKRTFNMIMTKKVLEPGYREAPDPRDPMAVVFMKVAEPKIVDTAKRGAKGDKSIDMADDELFRILQDYQEAISMYTATARRWLQKYKGYECKEPEPGKFTLVFQDLAAAIKWACHVQEELLYLPWPQTILGWEECKEVIHDNHLIFRGLRLRIGMSYGKVSSKKPLNTGRADYFGVVPNGAARVMGLAAPGQVLVEAATPPMHSEPQDITPGVDGGIPLLQPAKETTLQLQSVPGMSLAYHKTVYGDWQEGALTEADLKHFKAVAVKAVGYFELRGIENPRLIYEAKSQRLLSRYLMPEGPMIGLPGEIAPAGINASTSSKISVSNIFFGSARKRSSRKMQQGSPTSSSGSPAAKQQSVSSLKLKSNLGVGADDASVTGGNVGAGDYRGSSPQLSTGTAMSSILSLSDARLSTLGLVASRGQSVPRASSSLIADGCEGGLQVAASSSNGNLGGALDHRRSQSMSSQQPPNLQHLNSLEIAPSGVARARSDPHMLACYREQAVRRLSGLGGGAVAGQQQQQQLGDMVRHSSTVSSVMTDFISERQSSLPPIRTAMSPPDDHWTETPSSIADGSPFPVSPSMDGSNCSPMAAGSPAAAAAQQQRSQQQEQQMRNTLQLSGAGAAAYIASIHQPSAASAYNSIDYSAGLESPLRQSQQDVQHQQQQAHKELQSFQRMVSLKQDSDSVSSSLDGPALRMRGIFGGNMYSHQPGALQQATQAILGPARALLSNWRLRGSRHSNGGGDYAGGDSMAREDERFVVGSDHEDARGAAARQRLGMVGSSINSLPLTPGSAGSLGSYGVQGAALTSPLTGQFYHDYAQSFVTQRHNSTTSVQDPAAAEAWVHGGARYAASSANGRYSPQGGSPMHQGQATALASDTRHSSYTYAASSYSPHHFQRGVFSDWQLHNQAVSQQILQQQQQQQQHVLYGAGVAAAAAGETPLVFEPSLNGGSLALMAAGHSGTRPVDLADINPEFSLGMSRPGAPAALERSSPDAVAHATQAGLIASQDRSAYVAATLNSSMWASQEAQQLQQQLHQQLQLEEQQLQQQQQDELDWQQQLAAAYMAGQQAHLQQQQQLAQPSAESSSPGRLTAGAATAPVSICPDFPTEVHRYMLCSEKDSAAVAWDLARREDSASIAAKAASTSGGSFSETQQQRLQLQQELIRSQQQQQQQSQLLQADASRLEMEQQAAWLQQLRQMSQDPRLLQQLQQHAAQQQQMQLPGIDSRHPSQNGLGRLNAPSPLGNALRNSSITSLLDSPVQPTEHAGLAPALDAQVVSRAAAVLHSGRSSAAGATAATAAVATDCSSNNSSPRGELSNSQVGWSAYSCVQDSPRSAGSTPRQSLSYTSIRRGFESHAPGSAAAVTAAAAIVTSPGNVAPAAGPSLSGRTSPLLSPRYLADSAAAATLGNAGVGGAQAVQSPLAVRPSRASSVALDEIPEVQGMEGTASDAVDDRAQHS